MSEEETISKRTLGMCDSSAKNFKKVGKALSEHLDDIEFEMDDEIPIRNDDGRSEKKSFEPIPDHELRDYS